ncbi:MAG: transferrin-binding protein [Lysobacteraceae bacterium]|nr:MAG: transferrin-binding protein [Xanthomonadaceae bacterium]
MGYAQHNTLSAERQDTAFTTFTYGLDTPAGGVPRAGSGTFATDVFGLASVPGSEPDAFQGRGRFDVDFVNGLFSTATSLTRTGLISGNGVVGGGIDLTGGGRLASTSGAFSGDVVLSGGGRQIGGQLAGRFYGPNAEEIGASFAGSASDGSAFNGALTGQRDATLTAVNTSFARLITSQLFYADATTLTVRTPRNGGLPVVSDYPGQLGTAVSRSQFTDKTSGNVSFGPPSSLLVGGDYTVTSIVSGDANFTSYAKTVEGQATRLELYKTGSDNRELALTYASFGRYATAINTDPLQSEIDRVFFVYGFNTPSGLFANRTGTASYSGVAYGAGANASGTVYDVTGIAKMSVDFGSQALSGNLALAGRNGATTIDYGGFGFAGKLSSYSSSGTAEIRRDAGSSIGSMLVNFYGPAANEAAGVFRLRVPDGIGANTVINGAMVAKAQ